MKSSYRQILRSPKFMTGLVIFALILIMMVVYPLLVPGSPLYAIGQGSFLAPGTYISLYDAMDSEREILRLLDAKEKRMDALVSREDRVAMMDWLTRSGVPAEEIHLEDIDELLATWRAHYDAKDPPSGLTKARRNYFARLDNKILAAEKKGSRIVAEKDEATGQLKESGLVTDTDYVNIRDVANVRALPLGTDNFGRDMLKELLAASGTSIVIGLIAGAIATGIGLLLGLLAGYVGGWVDDLIMFFTNNFTVIPGFVLLILISYSIGQERRGAVTVALVIGLTSWVWTARSVRSQVISLRNRDHVNLSKLSGHSLFRIILSDILPYIMSYVVMAFILQVSSAILAEAQLSLLGLGPKTTEVPTLGLMMNWAMLYSAPITGAWWAYFPVILTIALISFSLNLMNTGLDQVFNPTLRG